MSRAQAVALLHDLVAREDAAIHLPSAALAIARVHYPDLSFAPWLEQLAEMGE